MKNRRFPISIFPLIAAGVLSATLCACTRTDTRSAGPPEKVTIAAVANPETCLVQVAQVKGFFADEGLDVTSHRHPYGKIALQELLEGKADFATVAETPVMFAVMKGEKIAVVATIMTSPVGNVLLAWKDRGIASVADLRGKRIAVTMGTTSQFFLENLLLANGISRQEVSIVDVRAEEIPDALARGKVDAASSFAPFTILGQNKLGPQGILIKDKDIYRYTFNIVATKELVAKNPGKVRKLLRALAKSENFVRENSVAAQKIVSEFIGLDAGLLRDIWIDQTYAVTLDQPLVLALEDESEWAIKNRLTTATTVPNYLNYIYLDGLQSVKPEAVRILK